MNYRIKICFSVLSSLFVVATSLCAQIQKKEIKLRTDGFYFYDNGIDTIVTIEDGGEMKLALQERLKADGFVFNKEYNPDEDTIAVNSIGSTSIDCLAFFNDTTGTEYGTFRRNDTSFINQLLSTIRRRREMLARLQLGMNAQIGDTIKLMSETEFLFTDMFFTNDTTFSFLSNKTYGLMAKKWTCSLKSDGTLHVRTMYLVDTYSIPPNLVYRFIPYNKIPHDLLRPKR